MSLFRIERRTISGMGTDNPFENPSVPLSSLAFDSVYGITGLLNKQNASGEAVTQDNAYSLPVVYRCISLLSTVVAGCPLNVYKDPGKKPIKVTSLDPANSGTTYTPYELWELVTTHLASWGNAYLLKMRNDADAITDLRPIYPGLVDVRVDKESAEKLFLVTRLNPDGTRMAAPPALFTSFEILHIPGMGYNGLTGLSPIQLAQQTIGTGMAADKLAARFYSQGTQLSGVINVKAPLADQQQADDIKQRWLVRNAGTAHSGSVAVLDAETTFQPLTIPPDQLQFLESRRWQTTELARLWGIPPHLVGDTEKSTSWGTGIEEQNVGFVSYTIAGYTERIQQRVTREVVNTRGQYAEFDLTKLMRGDTTERFNAYASGIQWGWLTRNEARIAENLEPIDGLDVPLTPLNMARSDVTGLEPPQFGITVPPAPATTAPAQGTKQSQSEEQK